LIRLSLQVPALASAWKLTLEKKYATHSAQHLRGWFLDSDTLRNPHLLAVRPVLDVNYDTLAISLGHRIQRGLNGLELGTSLRRNRNVEYASKVPSKQKDQTRDGDIAHVHGSPGEANVVRKRRHLFPVRCPVSAKLGPHNGPD
jgi:hypothetical protein